MKKFVLIFILSSVISFKILAQSNDTSICKCQYYSSYTMKMYRHKIDSICEKFKRKYAEIIFIGNRSFSSANVLIIVKNNNVYKGYFYDLIKGSRKTITNQKVSKIAVRLIQGTNAIQNSTKIKPQYISHDFSFFVSYNSGKDIFEVCYSQVLTAKDKPIGQLFTYYLENFK